MLTYAEELRQEGLQEGLQKGLETGKIEGKIEGTIETIDNLLAVGADWSMITRATGITPDEFATLKAQLNRLADPHAGDDAQQTTAG